MEIERKYLVLPSIPKLTWPYQVIDQGYLYDNNESSARIRIINNSSAKITIKKSITELKRLEFEYSIPVNDALEIFQNICENKLSKVRYDVIFNSKKWEIDIFKGDNEGLIIAEIELENENESFTLPPWIGEEVTSDPRYLNCNLAKEPYSKWK